MITPILTCQNCSFGYEPKRTVLEDVSFSLFEGEFVALLGPNGAGKSTLLKLLLHRLELRSGSIELNGIPITKLNFRQISELIGYVEQGTPQTAMIVTDYILLGAISQFSSHRFWFTAAEKKRANRLLEEVGIIHLRKKSIDQLSGGEQQLVQICRALMSSPRLLLLDEPVSHLDVQHIDVVIRLLLQLKNERNITILASIHDIHLAIACSDRLFLLDQNGALIIESNSSCPDQNRVEQVFSAQFDSVQVYDTKEKVLIPRYRYR